MRSSPAEVPDAWDFYPCRVDDATAFIFLNLWYCENGPVADARVLYWCDVVMADPADHGLGSPEEAKALYEAEEAFSPAVAELGLYYVGRLRNHGRWTMALFGPPGLEAAFSALSTRTFAPRKVSFGSKSDPEWSYFFDFLRPDGERRQWMFDRSVVDALEKNGDSLTKPRRVDHWLYFESARDRQAFLEMALEMGFEVEDLHAEGEPPRRFAAQVHRVDCVRLEEIHDVVMTLVRAAAENRGDYDGWETSVEKDGP